MNECDLGLSSCSSNAICTDTDGSFTCACKPGYSGDGLTCTDIDECADGLDMCAQGAKCTNTPGNYTCECVPPLVGDGFTCSGMNNGSAFFWLTH